MIRTGDYVLRGASHGAVVWAAYAVVEQALDAAAPLLKGGTSALAPSHLGVIAVVISSFLFLGFVSGAASGLFLKILDARGVLPQSPDSAARFRRVAVLTLALASVAGLMLTRPFGKAEALSLAASAALVVGLAVCERDPGWADGLGFLGNPWIASCLMVGGEWTGRVALFDAVPLVQLAGSVGALLAVVCVGAVGSRFWRRRGFPADSRLPVRAAAVLTVTGALVLGCSVLVTRWEFPSLPPLNSHALAGRPNIVLVTWDTVRADHLSLYGYGENTTPFLTELSRGATVYRHVIAASDLTLTSHASIFTGLYGSWHGAFMAPPEFPYGRPLAGRFPTLAQVLSAKGYRTMAVVANYSFLAPAFGLGRGFQTLYAPAPAVGIAPLFLRSYLRPLVRAFLSSDDLDLKDFRAGEINRAVFALLEQTRSEAVPLFLFVNYMDAHAPCAPPAPFNSLFPGRDRSLYAGDWFVLQDKVMHGARDISPAERRHFVSQYDGAVRYLDSQLGDLISELKNLGLFENTMIVITSDHGEAFGEKHLMGHGSSVYQDQVHVPLVIKYPHQQLPRSADRVASQVDLMPTVLKAVGFQAPDGIQGRDLQSLEGDAPRRVVSESFPLSLFGRTSRKTERAVFSGTAKFIALRTGERQLYDLARDAEERNDLYPSERDQARDLERYLEEWVKSVPASAADESGIGVRTLKRLKSLGYIP